LQGFLLPAKDIKAGYRNLVPFSNTNQEAITFSGRIKERFGYSTG
jgi:hypothetical protein